MNMNEDIRARLAEDSMALELGDAVQAATGLERLAHALGATPSRRALCEKDNHVSFNALLGNLWGLI